MIDSTEPETRKAALRESAARQAGILLPALAASTAYALAFGAMGNNLDDISAVLATIAMFTAPLELIVLLWRSGVRPPIILFGGVLGLALLCIGLLLALFAPVLVVMAVMAVADSIHAAAPIASREIIVLAFELLPLGQLAFIAIQLVRSALAPSGAPR